MAKAPKSVEKVVNEYGLKETKEMLQFVFAIAKIIVEAKRNDGSIGVNDLALLIQLFPHVGPAFEGIELIVKELKDLNEEEIKELLTFSAAHLGNAIAQGGDLALIIEKSLNAAVALVELIMVFTKKPNKEDEV